MDREVVKQERERNLRLIGELRLQAHADYLSGVEPATEEQRRKLPNIVFILMDDMGWGDMSSCGSKAIHTPHLDQLGADGAAFVNGYSSSPVCTPSRFGFLTGRYPSRGVISKVFLHHSYSVRVHARFFCEGGGVMTVDQYPIVPLNCG